MKFRRVIYSTLLLMILASCSSTKNIGNEDFYSQTWELEYLTGPRITFEGLFPDQKPYLTFNKTTNLVTGNAGCNGYSSDYTLKGNSLKFGDRGISTLMYCGDGEPQFVKMLKEIDGYKIDTDGKLNLLMGDITMMRFHKK